MDENDNFVFTLKKHKHLKIVAYNKDKEAILWQKQKGDHDILGKWWR